jgi:phosphomethylpyrimidine synthase
VRDYAAGLNDPGTLTTEHGMTAVQGMAAMSDKFNKMGQQVYVDAEKVKESNRVL